MYDYVSAFQTIWANILVANLTNISTIPDLLIDNTNKSPSTYHAKFIDIITTELGSNNPNYFDERATLIFELMHNDLGDSDTIELNMYEVLKEVKRVIVVDDQTFPAYNIKYIQNQQPHGRKNNLMFQVEFTRYGATRST